MSLIRKIKNFTTDSYKRTFFLAQLGFYKKMSDEDFIKMQFKNALGYVPDLENPRTYNEKLQWLKLHDRKPIYTTMVDKYEAKKYVADIIGEEYIIPTLGVWDRFEDIDFSQLPDQFVLKTTHDSGGVVICTDKQNFDIKSARKKLNRSLKRDYYLVGREWPYKNVKPRIIAEKYMVDETGFELKDYKVFNFGGKAKIVEVDFNRFIRHMRNLYTTDWEYIEAAIQYPTDPNHQIPRPEKLAEMVDLAEKLSEGFPQLRTDFYSIDDKLYFGELTFYHESGFGKFTPEEFGLTMGDYIRIPNRGGYLIDKGFIIWIHEKVDSGLKDYKFMCFNGKVRCSFICSERYSGSGLKVTFFDREWNKLPFKRHYPYSDKNFEKPEQYEKMVEISEKLSNDIPFVRTDLYDIAGQIYFGELTFYPGNGMEEFTPEEWDYRLGEWIQLPDYHYEKE